MKTFKAQNCSTHKNNFIDKSVPSKSKTKYAHAYNSSSETKNH